MITDQETVNAASSSRARAVVQAEMELIAARDQVRSLQEKALWYSGYDPEAYDAAITAYRQAREWAGTVRTAWRYWQMTYGPAGGAVGAEALEAVALR